MIAITKAIPNPKGINKNNKKINDEIHDSIEVPFCFAKFLQSCFISTQKKRGTVCHISKSKVLRIT